jgi:hypothetical protein
MAMETGRRRRVGRRISAGSGGGAQGSVMVRVLGGFIARGLEDVGGMAGGSAVGGSDTGRG